MESRGRIVVTPDLPNAAAADLGDEAIAWLVVLRSGRATAADRTAFQAWRRISPAHEHAAHEAEALWRSVGETRAAAVLAARPEPLASVAGPPMTRRAVLAGALAGSAAAVTVASGALGPVARLYADHSTGVGERRRIALPDGSVAHLNTASALSLNFSGTSRRLTLHAGEALFEAAADASRPFVAAAAGGEAAGDGAAFGLRHDAGGVSLVVRDGAVELHAAGTTAWLGPGQHAVYGGGEPVQVQPVDAVAATAWSRGKLIFNRRPLGEVVAELERYRHGRIVLTDERLRRLEVTGVFDLDDAADLLLSLEQVFGLRVVRMPLLTVVS